MSKAKELFEQLSGHLRGNVADPDAIMALVNGVNSLSLYAQELETKLASSSETRTPDPFTLQCAEELFGCHISPEGKGRFICAVCESPINIHGWVTAEHADDCFINQVRAYLAKHKPECVPGLKTITVDDAYQGTRRNT